MEYAKIESLNAVCALLEEIERDYPNIEYNDKQRIKEAIEFLDSLEQPAPLDPKTCELMVGDVVLFHGKELVVQRIKGGDIYAASSISIHGYTRDELTLKSNQRAGVQIETK